MRKHIYMPIIGLTFLLLSGCVYHVFDDPMTISTSSAAGRSYQSIRPVKVVTCDYWFLKTSVEHEFQDLWKRLLSEAEKAGGTAVIDAQFHGADGSFYWMIPPFGRTCWEARGIAARRL